MKYQRKTRDVYVVQQYTGGQYGWEDVGASYSRSDSVRDLRDYRTNQPEYPARLIVRRERIEVTA